MIFSKPHCTIGLRGSAPTGPHKGPGWSRWTPCWVAPRCNALCTDSIVIDSCASWVSVLILYQLPRFHPPPCPSRSKAPRRSHPSQPRLILRATTSNTQHPCTRPFCSPATIGWLTPAWSRRSGAREGDGDAMEWHDATDASIREKAVIIFRTKRFTLHCWSVHDERNKTSGKVIANAGKYFE